jgi:shikimate dehydrogenase
MATVINATPLGMAGEDLPDGVVERAAALLDMTYGAQRSSAVAHALALGIPTTDGLTMLTGQAVEAFELFTGQKAPIMTMEQAARDW